MMATMKRGEEHAAAKPAEMPSAAEIYEMIAQAAYYRAEKRGFTPGLEADDWLQAETEVTERLRIRRPHDPARGQEQ